MGNTTPDQKKSLSIGYQKRADFRARPTDANMKTGLPDDDDDDDGSQPNQGHTARDSTTCNRLIRSTRFPIQQTNFVAD